ncbi:MAG: family 16 glycosylhydrolase [Chitinivibrionales bacterium]|nr:family 16 glycosylhydrolase [Chitinivibrionales bacterium]
MRIRHACTAVLLICAAAIASPPDYVQGWQQTFVDQFDGASLDTTKWHPYDHFCGVRNSELQAYMTENVIVGDGVCSLKAEVREVDYGYCGRGDIVKQYASGMMITEGLFEQQYGYFEMRCRVPAGQGLWPAFWMLAPNRWPPEIDVLELLGHEPDKAYMTVHWSEPLDNHVGRGGNFVGPDFSQGYHLFAVEWRPDALVWYIDGVERHRSTEGIPHRPFYLLANLAVGGSWPGAPDQTTEFPATFLVDHVMAWQYPADVLAAFNHPPAVSFASPTDGAIVRESTTVNIAVLAEDDGAVDSVLLFIGDSKVATLTSVPYVYPWSPSATGTWRLQTTAYDNAGLVSDIARIDVEVIGADGNLIDNGQFDDGMDSWHLGGNNGAAVSGEIVDGLSGDSALHASITNGGSADWHVQLSQTLSVTAGDTLLVSFLGRADSDRDIRVMFQQTSSPYTEYWSQRVTLSTDAASYGSFMWVVDVTDPNAAFKFLIGGRTGDVWLDSVVVEWRPVSQATRTPREGLAGATRRRQAAVAGPCFDLRGRRVRGARVGSGVYLHPSRPAMFGRRRVLTVR